MNWLEVAGRTRPNWNSRANLKCARFLMVNWSTVAKTTVKWSQVLFAFSYCDFFAQNSEFTVAPKKIDSIYGVGEAQHFEDRWSLANSFRATLIMSMVVPVRACFSSFQPISVFFHSFQPTGCRFSQSKFVSTNQIAFCPIAACFDESSCVSANYRLFLRIRKRFNQSNRVLVIQGQLS